MSYRSIKIYGNQKVDYLIETRERLTDEEVESTMPREFMPDFDTFKDKINIMAPYTYNIVSSTISGLTEPLIGWQVYRSKKGDSVLYKVADVYKNVLGITDYLVTNRTEYVYYVIPVTESKLGITFISSAVKTNWWNWCVMSIKNVSGNVFIPEEIWTFDNNLTSGNIIHNIDKSVYTNFTKYPKVSAGESSYISGSISCLLGDVDCKTNTYIEPVEKMEAWRKFCASDNEIILKDRKGSMYRVAITENSSEFMDEIGVQPSIISFSYVECGDIGDITVYSTEIKDIDGDGDYGSTITGDKHYTYQQKDPAKVWEVYHNLKKYPSVTIVDTLSNVIAGDVTYIDDKRVTITFEEEVAGNAYFN